jgi:hypothetical protein
MGIARRGRRSAAGPPGAVDHSLGVVSTYGKSLVYFSIVLIVRRTF